ncbi:hypothetical protein QTQ03_23435 [Micromonospora sp. WMMA1363]|uniref:hypothetical protein n=1 Tax=Micromonospora sp. WMMA1363 TaxID=3053985 RepID=UPI00259C90AF|nr:hypothetical protein [Micromonospora sp. WMMA1363]MDM4722395.1 hypothetical protein [Micromonospora sp. WMMA1363]
MAVTTPTVDHALAWPTRHHLPHRPPGSGSREGVRRLVGVQAQLAVEDDLTVERSDGRAHLCGNTDA